MTRVALFGGSFNPPHVAHQLVALYVLETQPVDELWFVPVYEHVFGKPLAPLRGSRRDVRARGRGTRSSRDGSRAPRRSSRSSAVRRSRAAARSI